MSHPIACGDKVKADMKLRNSSDTAAPKWLNCLGMAAALLTAVVAGCDMKKLESPDAQADRQVQKAIQDARIEQAKKTTAGQDAAFQNLNQAAKIATASQVKQSVAQAALADAEVARATDKILAIDQKEVEINRHLWQIICTGAEADHATLTASTVRAGNDPDADPAKQVVDEINKQLKTFTDALATQTADAAKLTADIQSQQQTIEQLKQERTTATKEADDFAAQSARVKGRPSLDLYTKSTEARTRADIAFAKYDAIAANVAVLQPALDRANGQVAQLKTDVEQFKAAQQSVSDHWKQLQDQQIAAQKQAAGDKAKSITTGATTQPSHAQALEDLLKSVEQARKDAIQDLTSAIAHYESANVAAGKVNKEMENYIRLPDYAHSTQVPAWTALKDVCCNESYLRLRKGMAQDLLGDIYSAQVVELHNRQSVAGQMEKTFTAVGQPLPPILAAADLDKNLTDAQKKGAEAYDAAAKTLGVIALAPASTPDVKEGGIFGLAIGEYGLYILTGNTGHWENALKMATPGMQLPPPPPGAAPAPTPPPASGPAPAPTPPPATRIFEVPG